MRVFFSVLGPFALASLVLWVACTPQARVVQKEGSSIRLDSSYRLSEDTAYLSYINKYSRALYKEMNEVLVVSDVALTKDQPESLLGNVVSDIVFEAGLTKYKDDKELRPDICLLNNGGLRNSLPKGEITRGKIYELMPFENEIVIVTISGKAMEDLLNYIAAAGGVPVANIKMGIKGNKPVEPAIGGKPFDNNRNYNVVTSDYLLGGGDKMSFFKDPVKITYTKLKLRDALIDHMRELSRNKLTLTSQLDKRIYLVK